MRRSQDAAAMTHRALIGRLFVSLRVESVSVGAKLREQHIQTRQRRAGWRFSAQLIWPTQSAQSVLGSSRKG